MLEESEEIGGELIEPLKDRHTIIDEIGNNLIKVIFSLLIAGAFVYCLANFVGKDKGVDPNVPFNILQGLLT